MVKNILLDKGKKVQYSIMLIFWQLQNFCCNVEKNIVYCSGCYFIKYIY